MFNIYRSTISWVVVYAILLHITFALTILIDPKSLDATSLHTIADIFGKDLSFALCMLVAVMAVLAFSFKSKLARLFLMIPQQLLLLLSAGGAIQAMALSQFADGIVRSRGFIIADQAPAVIGAICHTIAVIQTARIEVK